MTDQSPPDPYVVLGVGQHADRDELRQAYERRIADAVRSGSLRTAQRVDAAYELLCNPFRREQWDRHGVSAAARRPAPEQRYAAPRAVPYRAWSPPSAMDLPPAPAGPRVKVARRAGRAQAGLVVLLIAALLGGAWRAGMLGSAGGPASGPGLFTNDVWGPGSGLVPVGAAGPTTGPPVHRVAHPRRLLPAVAGPPGRGGYRFIAVAGGRPVRFDPCRPVRYVLSGRAPFPGGEALLSSAIAEVSRDTGLQFQSLGGTTETPTARRPAYQPDRYGPVWAPVLIAWTDSRAVPALAGQVIGVGGGLTASVAGGQPTLVSGVVYLDAPDLAQLALRPDGARIVRAAMLHELGHLVGLAHVSDPAQVMLPHDDALTHYGEGDRRGLAILGAGPCPSTV